MARRNYLVEGLSGTGKSSVYEELIRRGYKAVSTDRAWKVRAGPDGSTWHEAKAVGELESPKPEVLFVCGSSRNRDRFLPYFTEVFNLRIDDDTMRRRLRERTNNDFGKEPEELELMLRLNRSDEKPAGAIDVDATRPLDQVVDELLRLADCSSVPSDSLPPWSKRGSAIAQSFVIAESAARVITCIEYSWSGEVLGTLLPYLRAQGIDLMCSEHDEVASVFVLTSDHRERYLARLDPAAFDGAVLRRYYEEVNETEAVGVGYAMLDGIAFLRDTLEPLESSIVAVLIAG
jgi:hypothetical protein